MCELSCLQEGVTVSLQLLNKERHNILNPEKGRFVGWCTQPSPDFSKTCCKDDGHCVLYHVWIFEYEHELYSWFRIQSRTLACLQMLSNTPNSWSLTMSTSKVAVISLFMFFHPQALNKSARLGIQLAITLVLFPPTSACHMPVTPLPTPTHAIAAHQPTQPGLGPPCRIWKPWHGPGDGHGEVSRWAVSKKTETFGRYSATKKNQQMSPEKGPFYQENVWISSTNHRAIGASCWFSGRR